MLTEMLSLLNRLGTPATYTLGQDIHITINRWRVMLGPKPRALFTLLDKPDDLFFPMTRTGEGWKAEIERPAQPRETLVFYTDQELAYWWTHDGWKNSLQGQPVLEWITQHILSNLLREWQAERVVNDDDGKYHYERAWFELRGLLCAIRDCLIDG